IRMTPSGLESIYITVRRTAKLRKDVLACSFLVIAILVSFWPVLTARFINYDDPEYVTENAQVRAGITPQGLQWAFVTDRAANWHPLTWLSHMLDVQLFGLNPKMHHAVNLFLH